MMMRKIKRKDFTMCGLHFNVLISLGHYVKKSALLFLMMVIIYYPATALPSTNSNDFDSYNLYDIVNNLQVGYYCDTGLAGPMWLLHPAKCGLTRTRAFWLNGNSLETLLNYKDYFDISQFTIDDGHIKVDPYV